LDDCGDLPIIIFAVISIITDSCLFTVVAHPLFIVVTIILLCVVALASFEEDAAAAADADADEVGSSFGVALDVPEFAAGAGAAIEELLV